MTKRLSRIRRGFTLIELLVVIAIIGVLASIVLASLNSARIKGRDTRRIGDIRQIQLALELYADANGAVYPTATGNAVAQCSATLGHGLEALAPTYISSVPKDPNGTGNAACYFYSTNVAKTRYHLGTTLEQNSNTALSSDRDCESNSTVAADTCDGSTTAYTSGFDGKGAATCGDTTAGTDACYDVAN